MACFVLVHGAWEAGWIWRDLARILRERGHDVFTPSLTGLGERAHLMGPGVDLETHVADLVNLLESEDLKDVTLVGHSYGGMPVGGAADRAPSRVAATIYLDAFIPESGKSMLDFVPPERAEGFKAMAKDSGRGLAIPVLPAVDWDVADPAHVQMLEALSVPHPLATMTQSLRLAGDALARRGAFILAKSRRVTPFPVFAEKARAVGWPVYELATHHFTMLSMPRETADILVRHAA